MSKCDLKPAMVFEYFGQINEIPRPSKHEERMIEFLKDFAKANSLELKVDHAGNVLIVKGACEGMENVPTLVLQAHMDMVCEKVSDIEFDFTEDSIQTYVDGDWMRAKGTTLGADDGIGVALCMAVLTDDEIKHGRVECLFTRDEETGLSGAFALDEGFMTGRYLVNLDSEDEGEIFIGCAGGANTNVSFSYDKENLPAGFFPLKICVDKLVGGHSGDDINKRRANANKLLVRFIYDQMRKRSVKLISFDGGNLHNAIPRHAEAVIAVEAHEKETVRAEFNVFASEIEGEFHATEPTMQVTMESAAESGVRTCIDGRSALAIIRSLQAVANGVQEMSQDIEGLVETSSNLASVKTLDDNVYVTTSQRSSSESSRKSMSDTVAAAFLLAGAEVEIGDGYPGWSPNPESKLLRVAKRKYVDLFGKEPKVKAIHAGLECGLFLTKYPYMDMISFGPTLRGVHSPDERLLIPTVDMVWKHLVAIIEGMSEVEK